MNRVEVIGICLEVTESYLILKVENSLPLKLFFNDQIYFLNYLYVHLVFR